MKDQTTQFIQTITAQLNAFFNSVSKHSYRFQLQNGQTNPDQNVIKMKKAYRHFKKNLILQGLVDPDFGQKARDRFAMKVWEQINDQQKLKYLNNKHSAPFLWLQKLALNISAKKKNKSIKPQEGNQKIKELSKSQNQITKKSQEKNKIGSQQALLIQ